MGRDRAPNTHPQDNKEMTKITKILMMIALGLTTFAPISAQTLENTAETLAENRLLDQLQDLIKILEKYPLCGESGRHMTRWLNKRQNILAELIAEIHTRPVPLPPQTQKDLHERFLLVYQILADRAIQCSEHDDIKEAFSKFYALTSPAPTPQQSPPSSKINTKKTKP
jgi:hypothetical protein